MKALILQLHLVKAYDWVDWGFLRLILLQIGLNLEATGWVMACVVSANYVVSRHDATAIIPLLL